MLNDTDIGGLDKFLASSGKDAFPRVQEHDNILAAGATLGSWRVEAFLGRGGSGEVYRVVHSVTRTPAAAKVLTRDDEVTKKRFQDEIDFLAQNQLPQFPRYFESGECDGRVYLVLELLEPIDVPTDEKGIAEYLTDVCSCVRALHLSGIVHRDLKPKNIMRRSSGEVVLIDFGLAKDTFVSARPRTDVSIVSGKAIGVGTPEYAAPEQFGLSQTDGRADIYSLAATLYHLATGRVLFPNFTTEEMMRAQCSDNYQARDPRYYRPALTEGFCQMLEAMLVKNRDYRIASWADVFAMCREIEKGVAFKPRPDAAVSTLRLGPDRV